MSNYKKLKEENLKLKQDVETLNECWLNEIKLRGKNLIEMDDNAINFTVFISKLEPQINPECFDLVTDNYYRIKPHDELYKVYKNVSK